MCLNKKAALKEFEEILKTYILPLLPIDDYTGLVVEDCSGANKDASICRSDDRESLSFYPSKETPQIYAYIPIWPKYELTLKPLNVILERIMYNSLYRYDVASFEKMRTYANKSEEEKMLAKNIYSASFELGLCFWMAGDKEPAYELYKLLTRLSGWSARNSCGKRVPFGFVFNYQERREAGNLGTYNDFLDKNDPVDCPDTVIPTVFLDKKGTIVEYRNIENENTEEDKEFDFSPIGYDGVARESIRTRIGIIVTEDGELVLIKNRSVIFAKRHNRWISYFEYDIRQTIERYVKMEDRNVKGIYRTLLDASFAHTGGCLIIIPSNKKNCITNIVRRFNNPCGGGTEGNTNFFKLNRKLRKELMQPKTAVIITETGEIVATNVKLRRENERNDNQTMTVRKLATYGLAIVISTNGAIDGYSVDPLNDEAANARRNRVVTKVLSLK